uniref:Morc S5 domain-containing protein n=1 Tax=Kalanchoe fedtschenkoi TaxID=63787 RepID=A0A7N0RBH9_KALFE
MEDGEKKPYALKPSTDDEGDPDFRSTVSNNKRSNNECSVGQKKRKVVALTTKTPHAAKQFWKAGDYEAAPPPPVIDDNYLPSLSHSGFTDHVRVHPRFLHSNATSHKWSLGAFAELLDNALDEACNGATYVNVDVLCNQKNGNKMLLIEDNGGGMEPDKMRRCMSLGYSEKSKMANTIGQYGNGFKTSTMRLGADVIVFSRTKGKNQTSPTQSVGLLSYSFLRSTGKEDIVVPMVDYEKQEEEWKRISRTCSSYFDLNMKTIIKWSPYQNEEELNQQLDMLKEHGTRIVIYNLWEDDVGVPELDLETDPHDILTRSGRNEKKEELARKYPNLNSLFTYQFSLRGYSSILYLTLPPGFRICLRGVDVVHQKLEDKMMMTKQHTYRPIIEGSAKKDPKVFAIATLGFVKEAKDHIDIHGFSVYHKNRLIMPLWRVWNPAGTGGRGVIGVLEANFIEPCHNKQGFECTKMMAKLVSRYANSHEVGYVGRPQSKASIKSIMAPSIGRSNSSIQECSPIFSCGKIQSPSMKVHYDHHQSSEEMALTKSLLHRDIGNRETQQISNYKQEFITGNKDMDILTKLREHNLQLKERLCKMNEPAIVRLREELRNEKERGNDLEKRLEQEKKNLDLIDKEHEALIVVFQEERDCRVKEEEALQVKLRETLSTTKSLMEKMKEVEHKDMLPYFPHCKREPL